MRRRLPCALSLTILVLAFTAAAGAQPATTTRVSVATGGTQGTGGSAARASISADGRYVAFESSATNLVAGDTNGALDVFVHDRFTGATTRVSVATGGAQANGNCFEAVISADGRFVAFTSTATNLVAGDTNAIRDVFVHDRNTGATTRVSVATGGPQTGGGLNGSFDAVISADGRYVAFWSDTTNMVAGDTNGAIDVFVHDRNTVTTTRVSVATGGAQGNQASNSPSISDDGRYVVFTSAASNLVAGDTNGVNDAFVRDMQAGTTVRVSVATGGAQANNHCYAEAISGDGGDVAFTSAATNLVAGDTTGAFQDVFVRSLAFAETERVSVATGGGEANGESVFAAFSADGRHVAFRSAATNLVAGDTNAQWDLFVHDLVASTTSRFSVATGGAQGNGLSQKPAVSASGRYVAFESTASNLVAGDSNGGTDIFVRDRGSWAHDYDGDRVADIAVFRPGTGGWYGVLSATGTADGVLWGTAGDIPVPADYDGDGATDVAVFRPGDGTWYVARSSEGSVGIPWGASGDTPAPGDYDGDGKADVAVFRPNANAWYIVRSSTGTATGVIWGDTGDLPVPADYDGDGKTDVAVFRGSTHAWYVVKSSTGAAIGFIWGDVGDIPVVADYDGDGKADVGVFRGSNHAWYIINSTTGTAVGFLWGDTGDVPVFGDYDGDGKADVAVFRPSTGAWYIRRSTGGAVGLFWGTAGDLPV